MQNILKNAVPYALCIVIGFLLSKWGCSGGIKTEYITKTDTVRTTQFVQSTPEILYKDREKIVYKDKDNSKTDTITKTVEVKIPYIKTEIQFKERLVKDTTCQDSIKTLLAYVDSLKYSIDTLIELKNYRASISKKRYNLSYDVLGRDVRSVQTEVRVKDNLHFYPTLIIQNQIGTNRYPVMLGGQLQYKKVIFGGGYGINPKVIYASIGIKLF